MRAVHGACKHSRGSPPPSRKRHQPLPSAANLKEPSTHLTPTALGTFAVLPSSTITSPGPPSGSPMIPRHPCTTPPPLIGVSRCCRWAPPPPSLLLIPNSSQPDITPPAPSHLPCPGGNTQGSIAHLKRFSSACSVPPSHTPISRPMPCPGGPSQASTTPSSFAFPGSNLNALPAPLQQPPNHHYF